MFGTFHVIFATAEPDKDRWVSLAEEGQSLKFGRAESNDLALKDSAVSKAHCQARFLEGRVLLTDTNSSHGTFVNGERISSEHQLRSGDLIRIGNTEILFRMETADEYSTYQELRQLGADDLDKAPPGR